MAKISKNIKKEKNTLVKVHNDLIESFVKKNNIVALKILFYIGYDCNLEEIEHLNRITMDTKQLLEFCNVNFTSLKRNLKQMTETSISFIDENSESYTSVLPKVKIIYGGNKGGKIELEIFGEVLEKIILVKGEYRSINVEHLMKLKSKHSIRMILLLEYINGFDEHIAKRKRYTLEELNYMFGTSYKRLIQFEKEVLRKIVQELDNNSKLSFIHQINYDKDTQSKGRPKAVSITIDLKDNNPQPTLF